MCSRCSIILLQVWSLSGELEEIVLYHSSTSLTAWFLNFEMVEWLLATDYHIHLVNLMFLCDINGNNSKSFFHISCKFDILWKFRDSTPPKFFQKWLVFRASNIKFTVFIRVRRDLFVSAKRRIHSAQINEPFKLIKDVRRKVTLTWCVFFRMSLLSAFIETGVRQHFLKISCARLFRIPGDRRIRKWTTDGGGWWK